MVLELFIHDSEDVAYAVAILQGKRDCYDKTITLYVLNRYFLPSDILTFIFNFKRALEWAEAVIGGQGDYVVEHVLSPLLSSCKTPLHIRFISCNLSDRAAFALAGALQTNDSIVGLSLKENPNISEEGYIALDRAAILTKAPLTIWNDVPLDNIMIKSRRAQHGASITPSSSARSSMDESMCSSVTADSVSVHVDDERGSGNRGDCAKIEEEEEKVSDKPSESNPNLIERTSINEYHEQVLMKGTTDDDSKADDDAGIPHDDRKTPPPELLEQEWEELEQKEKRLVERKRKLEAFRRDKEVSARKELNNVSDRLQALSSSEIELEAEWLRKEATFQIEKLKLEKLKAEFETCLARVLKKQDRLDFAHERLEETRNEIDFLKQREIELRQLLDKLKGISPGHEPPPCPICYTPLEKKQAIQCGHVFCPDCVDRLKGEPAPEKRVCAICRMRISVVVTLYD